MRARPFRGCRGRAEGPQPPHPEYRSALTGSAPEPGLGFMESAGNHTATSPSWASRQATQGGVRRAAQTAMPRRDKSHTEIPGLDRPGPRRGQRNRGGNGKLYKSLWQFKIHMVSSRTPADPAALAPCTPVEADGAVAAPEKVRPLVSAGGADSACAAARTRAAACTASPATPEAPCRGAQLGSCHPERGWIASEKAKPL